MTSNEDVYWIRALRNRALETRALIGKVWLDFDRDGVQDEGEPGIANVTVNLYDASGNLVATTVTDSDGGYLFPDLVPGTYTVTLTVTSPSTRAPSTLPP